MENLTNLPITLNSFLDQCFLLARQILRALLKRFLSFVPQGRGLRLWCWSCENSFGFGCQEINLFVDLCDGCGWILELGSWVVFSLQLLDESWADLNLIDNSLTLSISQVHNLNQFIVAMVCKFVKSLVTVVNSSVVDIAFFNGVANRFQQSHSFLIFIKWGGFASSVNPFDCLTNLLDVVSLCSWF